jgi:hypothetical protein
LHWNQVLFQDHSSIGKCLVPQAWFTRPKGSHVHRGQRKGPTGAVQLYTPALSGNACLLRVGNSDPWSLSGSGTCSADSLTRVSELKHSRLHPATRAFQHRTARVLCAARARGRRHPRRMHHRCDRHPHGCSPKGSLAPWMLRCWIAGASSPGRQPLPSSL